MLYDPEDLDQYAPLWSWASNLYVQLEGSAAPLAARGPLQVYVPGPVHARSSWLEIELLPCTAPAFLAAREDPMAVVKRQPMSAEGTGTWRLWDLVVSESHLNPLADKGQLSRRHGNLSLAILGWRTDPLVRSACLTQRFRTTVAQRGGTTWVELPRLEQEERFLPTILESVRGLFGGTAVRWDEDLPFKQQPGLLAAFRDGMVSVAGRRLRVTSYIGEDVQHKPTQHWRWLQRDIVYRAQTDVRPGPLPETLQLTAVPPRNYSEVRSFNEHLGLSPLHLLSHELLRVTQALATVRRWAAAVYDVAGWSNATLAANTVEDPALRKQFLCLDTVSECFRPVPSIWRSESCT